MLVNYLALLLDLFRNSEGTKLLIYTIIFCLVFNAPEKWRVELRAKTGHYRNRCFDSLLFYMTERSASVAYNISQAIIELFWLIAFNVWKNCHFWSCSILYSFVRMLYLCRNSLLKFYFGFDIEKTIPVYIPTHLVIFFVWITHRLLNALELENAWLQQKMDSHIVCCEKNWYLIFIETINTL